VPCAKSQKKNMTRSPRGKGRTDCSWWKNETQRGDRQSASTPNIRATSAPRNPQIYPRFPVTHSAGDRSCGGSFQARQVLVSTGLEPSLKNQEYIASRLVNFLSPEKKARYSLEASTEKNNDNLLYSYCRKPYEEISGACSGVGADKEKKCMSLKNDTPNNLRHDKNVEQCAVL